jgi:hypothetical protein
MDRAPIAATDVDMARRIPVKRQKANPASAAGYQRHEWAIRSAAGVLGFRGFLWCDSKSTRLAASAVNARETATVLRLRHGRAAVEFLANTEIGIVPFDKPAASA